MVLIAIGNSDDKLPQQRWASFQLELKFAVREAAAELYGEWHSYPDSIFQNCALLVSIDDDQAPKLRSRLTRLTKEYGQDSIAWNHLTDTDFLGRDT